MSAEENDPEAMKYQYHTQLIKGLGQQAGGVAMTRNTRRRKEPGDEQVAISPNATPKYPRLEGAAAAHQRAQAADCEAGLPDIVDELKRQLQDKEQEVRRLQADKQALAAELLEAEANQVAGRACPTSLSSISHAKVARRDAVKHLLLPPLHRPSPSF
ncbi:hypothetical protein HaLaN_06313 [Haematococcus lacustris]|uniref:Uncharacterized protein n=1 Tax=Haematococcus lacustris TaxID=44745 RepID=A0A699YWN0_HAELA|nr:hypothetical protein HaLaN_06313 [Haematococcus lacustris]